MVVEKVQKTKIYTPLLNAVVVCANRLNWTIATCIKFC